MSRHPEISWAQRTDKVFFTIELPDAKDPKIKLEPDGKFTFSGTGGPDGKLYEVDLDLHGGINVETSKISIGARHILCVLMKQETGHWPRLLKQSGKTPPYIKVDWNKWVDEDEETDAGIDNFDLGSMSDMSKFDLGGGDFGAEEEDSDDDGDLPELEK